MTFAPTKLQLVSFMSVALAVALVALVPLLAPATVVLLMVLAFVIFVFTWLALSRGNVVNNGVVKCAPIVVLAPVICLEYLARPLYILSKGEWGWNAFSLTQITPENERALLEAFLIVIVAVSAMCLTYAFAYGRAGAPSVGDPDLPLAAGVTAIVLGFAAMAIGLSQTARGFGDADALSIRSISQSGYIYALNFGSTAGILLAVCFVRADILRSAQFKLLVVSAVLAAVVLHAGFLGGRSEPLTLVLAVGIAYGMRRGGVGLKSMLLVACVLLVAGVAYRVAVREVFFQDNRGMTAQQLLARSAESPFDAILGGQDVSAFDKLLELRTSWRDEPFLGETLASVLVRWIPMEGGLAATEGGNETFTRTLYPERFGRGAGLDGVSLLGEGYINFGWLGPPLVGSLLVVVLLTAYKTAGRGGIFLAFYALMAARIPGFIRGDVLHSVMGLLLPLAIMAAILVAVYALQTRKWRPEFPEIEGLGAHAANTAR